MVTVNDIHIPEVKAADVQLPADHSWAKLPMIGAALAGVGFVLTLVLAFGDGERFFFSAHTALMYGSTIGLGALFFVLIQHATNAGWSITMRRFAENIAGTLPIILPLSFLVMLLGMDTLFPWTDPAMEHHHLVSKKLVFLNTPFFLVRSVIWIGALIAISLFFLRKSVEQDSSGDHTLSAKMRSYSYPALIGFVLALHFGNIDWTLSLDPEFFSTMWGVYIFAGSTAAAFALLALVSVLARSSGVISKEIITIEHLHDIGKLTFAFVTFWSYIAFFQYFLIWYADIPEETYWYLARLDTGWGSWSYFLFIGHFVIPFFFLMSRHIKRNPITLSIAAVWILIVHYVDLYWIVMPNLDPDPHFSIMDVSTMLTVIGLLLAGFGFWLRRHAVTPHADPRFEESMAFENF